MHDLAVFKLNTNDPWDHVGQEEDVCDYVHHGVFRGKNRFYFVASSGTLNMIYDVVLPDSRWDPVVVDTNLLRL
ncbi:unnamed protein product [Linum trigynum]|uniref:Uncharacterized protein n=1 Tax=Linum trigynum TaxID=586398 RepID=A0AAV2FFU5_9ROSI